jgi:hypothetical protein
MLLMDEGVPEIEPVDKVAEAAWRLSLVKRFAECAMSRLQDLTANPTPEGDRNFATISRAGRLAVMLSGRLVDELADLQAGIVREREAEKVKVHKDRRQRVGDLVMHVARDGCESDAEYGHVWEALDERLDDDAAYFDLDRPFRDIVEDLCRDLTLTPDWDRWENEGWKKEPGPFIRPTFSPFATPSARRRCRDRYGHELTTPAEPYRLPSSRALE